MKYSTTLFLNSLLLSIGAVEVFADGSYPWGTVKVNAAGGNGYDIVGNRFTCAAAFSNVSTSTVSKCGVSCVRSFNIDIFSPKDVPVAELAYGFPSSYGCKCLDGVIFEAFNNTSPAGILTPTGKPYGKNGQIIKVLYSAFKNASMSYAGTAMPSMNCSLGLTIQGVDPNSLSCTVVTLDGVKCTGNITVGGGISDYGAYALWNASYTGKSSLLPTQANLGCTATKGVSYSASAEVVTKCGQACTHSLYYHVLSAGNTIGGYYYNTSTVNNCNCFGPAGSFYPFPNNVTTPIKKISGNVSLYKAPGQSFVGSARSAQITCYPTSDGRSECQSLSLDGVNCTVRYNISPIVSYSNNINGTNYNNTNSNGNSTNTNGNYTNSPISMDDCLMACPQTFLNASACPVACGCVVGTCFNSSRTAPANQTQCLTSCGQKSCSNLVKGNAQNLTQCLAFFPNIGKNNGGGNNGYNNSNNGTNGNDVNNYNNTNNGTNGNDVNNYNNTNNGNNTGGSNGKNNSPWSTVHISAGGGGNGYDIVGNKFTCAAASSNVSSSTVDKCGVTCVRSFNIDIFSPKDVPVAELAYGFPSSYGCKCLDGVIFEAFNNTSPAGILTPTGKPYGKNGQIINLFYTAFKNSSMSYAGTAMPSLNCSVGLTTQGPDLNSLSCTVVTLDGVKCTGNITIDQNIPDVAVITLSDASYTGKTSLFPTQASLGCTATKGVSYSASADVVNNCGQACTDSLYFHVLSPGLAIGGYYYNTSVVDNCNCFGPAGSFYPFPNNVTTPIKKISGNVSLYKAPGQSFADGAHSAQITCFTTDDGHAECQSLSLDGVNCTVSYQISL